MRVEPGQGVGVAYGAVQHQAFPAVLDRERGDQVPDQGRVGEAPPSATSTWPWPGSPSTAFSSALSWWQRTVTARPARHADRRTSAAGCRRTPAARRTRRRGRRWRGGRRAGRGGEVLIGGARFERGATSWTWSGLGVEPAGGDPDRARPAAVRARTPLAPAPTAAGPLRSARTPVRAGCRSGAASMARPRMPGGVVSASQDMVSGWPAPRPRPTSTTTTPSSHSGIGTAVSARLVAENGREQRRRPHPGDEAAEEEPRVIEAVARRVSRRPTVPAAIRAAPSAGRI